MISIVIPFHYRQSLYWLNDTLLDLCKKTDISEIILVINGGKINFTPPHQLKIPIKIVFQDLASAANARNMGLQMTCKEYVLFLDADIKLCSNWINENLAILKKLDFISCIQGQVIPNDQEGLSSKLFKQLIKKKSLRSFTPLESWQFTPCVDSCALLIVKSKFSKTPFDSKFPRMEDLDFSFDTILSKGKYVYFNQNVSCLKSNINYVNEVKYGHTILYSKRLLYKKWGLNQRLEKMRYFHYSLLKLPLVELINTLYFFPCRVLNFIYFRLNSNTEKKVKPKNINIYAQKIENLISLPYLRFIFSSKKIIIYHYRSMEKIEITSPDTLSEAYNQKNFKSINKLALKLYTCSEQ